VQGRGGEHGDGQNPSGYTCGNQVFHETPMMTATGQRDNCLGTSGGPYLDMTSYGVSGNPGSTDDRIASSGP
jgi:hypothetical protein